MKGFLAIAGLSVAIVFLLKEIFSRPPSLEEMFDTHDYLKNEDE